MEDTLLDQPPVSFVGRECEDSTGWTTAYCKQTMRKLHAGMQILKTLTGQVESFDTIDKEVLARSSSTSPTALDLRLQELRKRPLAPRHIENPEKSRTRGA